MLAYCGGCEAYEMAMHQVLWLHRVLIARLAKFSYTITNKNVLQTGHGCGVPYHTVHAQYLFYSVSLMISVLIVRLSRSSYNDQFCFCLLFWHCILRKVQVQFMPVNNHSTVLQQHGWKFGRWGEWWSCIRAWRRCWRMTTVMKVCKIIKMLML